MSSKNRKNATECQMTHDRKGRRCNWVISKQNQIEYTIMKYYKKGQQMSLNKSLEFWLLYISSLKAEAQLREN